MNKSLKISEPLSILKASILLLDFLVAILLAILLYFSTFYPIYQKNYGVKSIDDYFIGFHLVGNTLSILYDLYRRSYNYDERKFVIAEICALLQGVKGKYEKYVYSYTNKIKFRLIHMPFFVLNFVFKIQAIWK